MEIEKQRRFDAWWYKNRTKLLDICINEPDFHLGLLDIAEKVWEGAVNDAKKDKEIDQEAEKS